jgi:hypothetical protein
MDTSPLSPRPWQEAVHCQQCKDKKQQVSSQVSGFYSFQVFRFSGFQVFRFQDKTTREFFTWQPDTPSTTKWAVFLIISVMTLEKD